MMKHGVLDQAKDDCGGAAADLEQMVMRWSESGWVLAHPGRGYPKFNLLNIWTLVKVLEAVPPSQSLWTTSGTEEASWRRGETSSRA